MLGLKAKGLAGLLGGLALAVTMSWAYEVPISDEDYSNQICSGMWGGEKAAINGA